MQDKLKEYFDIVELTFSEVKLRAKQLYKDNDVPGEHPHDYLKAVVYETKITNTVIIMKIDNLTVADRRALLYFDNWKQVGPHVFKYINSNTGNIFIIDANNDTGKSNE